MVHSSDFSIFNKHVSLVGVIRSYSVEKRGYMLNGNVNV
jgi:hypothetical protein